MYICTACAPGPAPPSPRQLQSQLSTVKQAKQEKELEEIRKSMGSLCFGKDEEVRGGGRGGGGVRCLREGYGGKLLSGAPSKHSFSIVHYTLPPVRRRGCVSERKCLPKCLLTL